MLELAVLTCPWNTVLCLHASWISSHELMIVPGLNLVLFGISELSMLHSLHLLVPNDFPNCGSKMERALILVVDDKSQANDSIHNNGISFINHVPKRTRQPLRYK